MTVKISALPSASTPTGTELVPVVQGGVTAQTTVDAIALKSKTLAQLNTQVSDATLIDTADSRLSDSRAPTAHTMGGAAHTAATLAELNALVSDATLIDTADSRLSDSRAPTAHALDAHSAVTLAALNAVVSDATLIDTADSRLSDARTPSAHTVASHSDTTATGANLDELVGGGATTLHSHAGGGGVTALSVVNIDDPSIELNAIAGSAKGDLRLCYQTVAGKDEWTLYAWDNADSGLESVPYTVDGSSGMWSALGGKYNSSSLASFSGEVHFTGTDKIYLDTDKDTYFWPVADDDLRLYAGGSAVARYQPSTMTVTPRLLCSGELQMQAAFNHDGSTVGFYGTTPVAQQTGVAVTASAIHAALVALGLITA